MRCSAQRTQFFVSDVVSPVYGMARLGLAILGHRDEHNGMLVRNATSAATETTTAN